VCGIMLLSVSVNHASETHRPPPFYVCDAERAPRHRTESSCRFIRHATSRARQDVTLSTKTSAKRPRLLTAIHQPSSRWHTRQKQGTARVARTNAAPGRWQTPARRSAVKKARTRCSSTSQLPGYPRHTISDVPAEKPVPDSIIHRITMRSA